MDRGWKILICILAINVGYCFAIAADSEDAMVTVTTDDSFVLEGE